MADVNLLMETPTQFRNDCPSCQGLGFIPSGLWLRELRYKRGMTLHDVATATGRSVVYISDVERGKRTLPIELAAAMLTAIIGNDPVKEGAA